MNILDKNEIDIVLYHGSCSDGFGSAFIIWNYYNEKFGLERASKIEYIPCYYQHNLKKFDNDFIEKIKNKNVIMCDFAYKIELLNEIINVTKSFMILDHHKTAESQLLNIDNNLKIFDMNRSGVGITWKFFYDQIQMPLFLLYIEDRDIWKNEYDESLPFSVYLHEEKFDFNEWKKFLDQSYLKSCIEKGINWRLYQKKIINKIVHKTTYIMQEIDGKYYLILYCNSPEFKSDVGNTMMKHYTFADFACIWDYYLQNNQTNYSLRSTDSKSDVSIIASKFGGGGHRNASGISFSGIQECLPFPKIHDHDIINLLYQGKQDYLMMLDNKKSYVLFRIERINKNWLEPKYLDFIKRKYSSSDLIIFMKELNQFENEKQLFEYIVYLNDGKENSGIDNLCLHASNAGNYALTFTTTENVDQIFKK